ncbi:MAG TPA: zinc-binding dehydrogenase [Chthoniobacterales bacterium]|nr:zinc-binding dehydrogenase [Chthoniobacterales bacterium]
MKAVQLSRFGDPDLLEVVEVPTPQPEPGEVLVRIRAAGGGVGSLLIQLVKRAGAKLVIATASKAEKLELAKSLGADFAFNYSGPDWPAFWSSLTSRKSEL